MSNNILKNKVAKNAFWIIIGKLVQSGLALVVNMMTARYFRPSNFGLISYAASIVAFVVPIMSLGFSNILVQEHTNFPEEEGEIFGTAISLSVLSAIVCMVGVFSYTLIADAGEKETNIVVVLYSCMLIFQALELIQYWFQSKLISKYTSAISLCAYIIVSVYKILLLVNGANVYYFAIANSIDYCIIALLLLVVYRKLKGAKLRFSINVAKRMFASSKHYIISSLMVTIFAQTDRIMLKLMINTTEVGYYTAAVACAGLTSFIFSALIDSMRPSIFACKKNKQEESYELNLKRTYCIVIYCALAQSILMTVLAKFIVGILYGQAYSASIKILQVVVWYTTFSYIRSVRNIWILCEHKQKYLWIVNLSGAMANIILNLILIPKYGAIGAAIASLVTQFFTNVIMNYIIWPLKNSNKLMFKSLNPNLIISAFRKKE